MLAAPARNPWRCFLQAAPKSWLSASRGERPCRHQRTEVVFPSDLIAQARTYEPLRRNARKMALALASEASAASSSMETENRSRADIRRNS